MTHFIKPEYLVSLYLILNDKEEVSLYNLASYAGALNAALNEKNVRAVFLYSDKYVDEMLSDYKDYFEYIGLYEDVSSPDYCTPWIKRKVSNEVLSEKFTSYLSNDVLKASCDLNKREKFMTTEEKIKIMHAYIEGKNIQSKAVIGEHWCDDFKPNWDWNHFEYRIKPEPTYRPYKDIEELFEDIKKRAEKIQHPLFSNLWLKHKTCGVKMEITGFDESEEKILLGTSWTILKVVFDSWTYLDGSPFGIKETVND